MKRALIKPELNRVYTADAVALLSRWRARSFDLLLCDPPYGNNISYGSEHRRIIGDEHPLVGLHAIAASYRLLRTNSIGFVFCAPMHLAFIEHFIARYTKFKIAEVLCWDKRSPGFGTNWRRQFENILVLEKGSPSYLIKGLPTVLAHSRASAKPHPHAKPVDLLMRLIEATTSPGQIVLDPFAGSGSTCAAALRSGRRFVGIEIDPLHAEHAKARLREAAA